MQALTIQKIDKDLHLRSVIALGRANKKTLGLFPDEAFSRYAAEGRILVGADEAGECVGYLLYDKTRGTYVIVHLCVAETCRGAGVAEALAKSLVDLGIANAVRGISLKCRRDYRAASRLWKKLGFVAQTEVRGRSKTGRKLVYWWKNLKNTNLFAAAADFLRERGITAVLDANVFFDIMEPEETAANIPSKALRSDWLVGTVHLCVVGELFNEFLDQGDEQRRQANRDFATEYFSILPYDGIRFDQVCSELRPLFAHNVSDRDRADLRQVAGAIAAEASFFVTRDNGILKQAEELYERYRLAVLRPADLITRLDENVRSSEYQPVRFAGARISLGLASHADRDALVSAFQHSDAGETKVQFVRKLDRWLSQPSTWRCSYIAGGEGRPLALSVEGCEDGTMGQFDVPLLRLARDPLSSTLAYQLVKRLVISAVQRQCHATAIGDEYLQPELLSALQYFGFFWTGDFYCKLGMPLVAQAEEIAGRIKVANEQLQQEGLAEWIDDLCEPRNLHNVEWASLQEHYLWPAKLSNARIPCYIVPVQPQWAMHLFDEAMAERTLFGREQRLALNVEAAYYSGAIGKPAVPARIMWYVSGKRGRNGGMRLRACSRLVSADSGPPSELYRRNKHLGIYSWPQVFEAAHRDLEHRLMALRFDDTEVFTRPVHWDVFQPLLQDAGIRTFLRRPTPVPSSVFLKLYKMGTR